MYFFNVKQMFDFWKVALLKSSTHHTYRILVYHALHENLEKMFRLSKTKVEHVLNQTEDLFFHLRA